MQPMRVHSTYFQKVPGAKFSTPNSFCCRYDIIVECHVALVDSMASAHTWCAPYNVGIAIGTVGRADTHTPMRRMWITPYLQLAYD